MNEKRNGDISGSSPGMAPAVVVDSDEGRALKTWQKLAVSGGVVVLLVLGVVDRIDTKTASAQESGEKALTAHADRPHKGAATKEDLARIELQLTGQQNTLQAILVEVQK